MSSQSRAKVKTETLTLAAGRDPKWDYNTLTVEDVFRAIQSNPGEIDVRPSHLASTKSAAELITSCK